LPRSTAEQDVDALKAKLLALGQNEIEVQHNGRFGGTMCIETGLTFEELFWVCVHNDKRRFQMVFQPEKSEKNSDSASVSTISTSPVSASPVSASTVPDKDKGKDKDLTTDAKNYHTSTDASTISVLPSWHIRAVQGHTSHVDESLLLTPVFTAESDAAPDGLLYHGTYKAVLPDILASGGLSRMTRQHIHFTGISPILSSSAPTSASSTSAQRG
ncbi:unnamed protein product, partial [Amoebophrya sp. A25]